MTSEMYFYIDDSGSRDLDRKSSTARSIPDWFALGGAIVRQEHQEEIENRLAALRARWPQMGAAPLRSYDIRNRTTGFRWLEVCGQTVQENFLDDLTRVIVSLLIVCTACVIDRRGYETRYRERYGLRRWLLCKTAFSIVVERAAKFALLHDCRLRGALRTSSIGHVTHAYRREGSHEIRWRLYRRLDWLRFRYATSSMRLHSWSHRASPEVPIATEVA